MSQGEEIKVKIVALRTEYIGVFRDIQMQQEA
jgi:hypothetical protein